MTGVTFNKADRGSYACIYGGRINGDTDQPTSEVQSASGRWTLDRQIFAILCNWPFDQLLYGPGRKMGKNRPIENLDHDLQNLMYDVHTRWPFLYSNHPISEPVQAKQF